MAKKAQASLAMPPRKGTLYSTFIGKNYWQLYLLALLPVLFVLIFSYFPMYGLMVAFKDYSIRKGIMGSAWAGFKYFEQLFSSPLFPVILKNTLILSILSFIVGFPFPIILALAFNELSHAKLKKVMQTITFAPYFISTVVVVSIVLQIFSYRFGIVSSILQLLGSEPVDFYGSVSFFRPAYILSGVWQTAGYSSILYIAALSSVDVSLHEAASIDGASRFQKMWHIDLPCIRPTIIITLILAIGGIMNVGFEKVFLFQNPSNYNVSEVIATYVYKAGITQAQFSFATAVGLFNSVVNCILLLIFNGISSKVSETSLF